MNFIDKIKKISKQNYSLNILLSSIYNHIYSLNSRKTKGKNNQIKYNCAFLKKIKIDIVGENNKIIIGRNTRLINCKIFMRGNNHKLIIGDQCTFKNSSFWFEDSDCKIIIGNKTTSEGSHFASIEPRSLIDIGQDCMFSHDIELRTGDSHSIIDMTTSKRINLAENIIICNHVWIGAYSKILKGVKIEENAVIGLGTIVTKNIKKCTVNVGIPSKTIKENITWDRERIFNS